MIGFNFARMLFNYPLHCGYFSVPTFTLCVYSQYEDFNCLIKTQNIRKSTNSQLEYCYQLCFAGTSMFYMFRGLWILVIQRLNSWMANTFHVSLHCSISAVCGERLTQLYYSLEIQKFINSIPSKHNTSHQRHFTIATV